MPRLFKALQVINLCKKTTIGCGKFSITWVLKSRLNNLFFIRYTLVQLQVVEVRAGFT